VTIADLSAAAGCSYSTVYRVARRLFASRLCNGRRTKFDETESVRIMAEVRKRGFMMPVQNDKQATPGAPISAGFLRELVKLYGHAEARRRFDHLIGYGRQIEKAPQRALPAPGESEGNPFERIRRTFKAIDASKSQRELEFSA